MFPGIVCLTLASALAGQDRPARPMKQLESEVSAVVAAFRGLMGVAVVDLATGEAMGVNADERFPTASTIKTAVMVAAYQQIADGTLALDTTVPLRTEDKVGGSGVLNGLHEGLPLTIGDLIHLMIVLSDNTATNMLIGRIGTARVNERLDAYRLPNTRLFRPTFRDGRPDVLPELEREFGLGMTTPREMAALMAMIGRREAVSESASDAMLATLRRQQDRAMIPRLLPSSVQVANKTGTDEEKHAGPDGVRRHVRADAAVVTGAGFRYAIAICARRIEDTRWGVENDAVVTGARVSRIVYDHFAVR
jgi:beta-lactamase class A